jgi:hypothetical protein
MDAAPVTAHVGLETFTGAVLVVRVPGQTDEGQFIEPLKSGLLVIDTTSVQTVLWHPATDVVVSDNVRVPDAPAVTVTV